MKVVFILASIFILMNCQKPPINDVTYNGVETGTLNIWATSEHQDNHGIDRFPLSLQNYREGSKAYCTSTANALEYVILASPLLKKWHKLLTTGRQDVAHYVTSFKLSYTQNGVDWKKLGDYDGNTDQASIKEIDLKGLIALAIKIQPRTWQGFTCFKGEAIISDVNEKVKSSRGEIPAIASGIGRVSTSTVHALEFGATRIELNFSNMRVGAAGWCALANTINEWIQVSTGIPQLWTSISTMPRGDALTQRITSYYIQYSNNGKNWKMAENGQIFESDSVKEINHKFEEPFTALMIRLVPVTWTGHICARVEFFYKIE